MADYDSLLFPMFKELRHLGIPLGVPDYLLMLEVLRSGVGLDDVFSLKRLCNLIWAKSLEDQDIIDVAFSTLVAPLLQTIDDRSISSSEEALPFPSVLPSPDLHSPMYEYDHELEPVQRLVEHKRELPIGSLEPHPKKSPLEYFPKKYHMTPRLPMDRREIAGLCRQLRRPKREGSLEELDVESTIKSICQTGFFLSPVLRPRHRNQSRLLLLIDQQGSMSPFSLLIEAFTESIVQNGLLGKIKKYYYHDCPTNTLFEQPSITIPVSITEVLSEHAKNNAVLIFSDAGAARGHFDHVRLAETKEFLKLLNTYTYLYAWLNPLPPERWTATTAEDIAGMVPMFPFVRDGLVDTFTILQGHPFPTEVRIDE